MFDSNSHFYLSVVACVDGYWIAPRYSLSCNGPVMGIGMFDQVRRDL